MTFQQLRQLRKDHLRVQHDLTFYPYQEVISDAILIALINNLNITKNASPADVETLRQEELAFEISRQAGKTYSVGYTNEIIMAFLSAEYGRPIRIGVFAPQVDQAKLSYEITRNALRPIKGLVETTLELKQQVREEENAKRLVLPNGSSCTIAPITTTSKIEGLTLDLIIIDEAQTADDEIVKHSIFPMGKTTNAPRVYIGKAGTQICHFYRLGQMGKTYKVYFNDVVPQRRRIYQETKDVRHLIYEQSVKEDIALYGIDSDEIQREYFGKWQIGTGNFVTEESLDALIEERAITPRGKEFPCFAGIDTAKHPDSTIVTILRYKDGKKQVINWLELRGDNYQDQYDIIISFLNNYRIEAIAIDSTGQGDFMPDMFERHSNWADENSGLYRVKFSQTSKDQIYKNLKVSIRELLTTLPRLDTRVGERFRQQMLDLQQEYKGQFLSVSHPDDPNAHDDYPDSWALAEWAYARWNEADSAQIAVATITTGDKERKVIKDESNKVVEYWPGLDLDDGP